MLTKPVLCVVVSSGTHLNIYLIVLYVVLCFTTVLTRHLSIGGGKEDGGGGDEDQEEAVAAVAGIAA